MDIKTGKILAILFLLLILPLIVFLTFLYIRDTKGFQIGKYYFAWRYEDKEDFYWSYTRMTEIKKDDEPFIKNRKKFKLFFFGTLKDKDKNSREINIQLGEHELLAVPVYKNAIYYKWIFGFYLPGKSIFVWTKENFDAFWEENNINNNLLFFSFSPEENLTSGSEIMIITEKIF